MCDSPLPPPTLICFPLSLSPALPLPLPLPPSLYKLAFHPILGLSSHTTPQKNLSSCISFYYISVFFITLIIVCNLLLNCLLDYTFQKAGTVSVSLICNPVRDTCLVIFVRWWEGWIYSALPWLS